MTIMKSQSDQPRREVVVEVLAQAVLDLVCTARRSPGGNNEKDTTARRRARPHAPGSAEEQVPHAAG